MHAFLRQSNILMLGYPVSSIVPLLSGCFGRRTLNEPGGPSTKGVCNYDTKAVVIRDVGLELAKISQIRSYTSVARTPSSIPVSWSIKFMLERTSTVCLHA
ncbi:hypothetical protein Q1695_002322 [Nippostrongylus brasiliensis]|nr:hypothetical protein Q1695_002322 [Nippostrongylus brasiliensis]